MTVFLLLAGLLVFFTGVTLSLCQSPGQELEQAALLPFADDPAAAQAMSDATGRRCDKLVTPVDELSAMPESYLLEA